MRVANRTRSHSYKLRELAGTYTNILKRQEPVETEELREIVKSALNEMSAEAIAALAGGIASKSVYNFATRSIVIPRRATRRGLERFAAMWQAGLRSKGEYIDGSGALRVEMQPSPDVVPRTVQKIIQDGQREQMQWVRDFAAKILEAQASAIRMMDSHLPLDEDVLEPEAPPVTPPSPEPETAVGASKAVAAAEARGAKGVARRPRQKPA